jgi:four helix bundle protein
MMRPSRTLGSTKGADVEVGTRDLDRDWERAPASGEVVSLRARRERPAPPALAPISIETIAALRPVVLKVRRRDRELAARLVRATSDVAMNIAEAEHADVEVKKARFGVAAGSANEAQAALRVAVAWGYVEASDAEVATALLGRVIAMLWRLSRGS